MIWLYLFVSSHISGVAFFYLVNKTYVKTKFQLWEHLIIIVVWESIIIVSVVYLSFGNLVKKYKTKRTN